jgi:hypothetical protein
MGTHGTKFSNVGSPSANDGWAPGGALSILAAQTTDGINTYAGLFTSCKGTLSKLLDAGDVLDGVAVQPAAGISNLVAGSVGGVASYQGAILVGAPRYAAVYTVTVPDC